MVCRLSGIRWTEKLTKNKRVVLWEWQRLVRIWEFILSLLPPPFFRDLAIIARYRGKEGG